jgi:RNA polymerase-binding transcription factor DksA
MANLSSRQLDQLKSVLDARFKELSEELRRELRERHEYLDVASDVPDPGDAAFASLEIDLGNAEATRDLMELRAIDVARKSMEDGSYGECLDCGTDIPFERLTVQPVALRCAPCQDIYERTHAMFQRGGSM